MAAMSAEYPEMRILSFFLTSHLTSDHTYRGPDVVAGDDVQARLAVHQYNLLVSFLIGWLEQAPTTMRIVDGNENAYYYKSQRQYDSAVHSIKTRSLKLIPSGLHQKYQQVVQAGHAIYLDNCQPAHRLHVEIDNRSPRQILEQRLQWALESSDQYVWVWAERGRFVISDPQLPESRQYRAKFPLWDEVFPGALEIFQTLRNSASRAEQLAAQLEKDLQRGQATALLGRDDAKRDNQWLRDWKAYQPKWSFGTLRRHEAEFAIAGTAGGVLFHDFTVEPGQTVHVVSNCSIEGQGQPMIWILALALDQNPMPSAINPPAVAANKSDPSGEFQLHHRMVVPEDCQLIRVMVGARSQGDADDVMTVKAIKVYRIGD